ncbi:MAG: disulfide reductase [Chloroflexi bacterium]|nr:MAG: disulfide reductase [Chloroflexota bacterium]RLC88106.1 MAG: disulfide reductase [Chloroflexota bacterium]HEY68198.1 disulfide reductase [Thermoflexia bacterium]
MGIPYYPGCTLSTKAKGYDRSGRAVAEALGLELVELTDWQCCGATFPLMLDDSMALIAPTRVLYQAQQAGERVATLCAICFNVLRRSQALLRRDPEMLERINWFTEQEYHGDVHVVHFLEILRDDLGWEALAERVVRPLAGLRVAPYYGCLLLRPYEEIGLDDPENPVILHNLVRALGAEPVDFPYNIECCGSYLTVKEPQISETLSKDIVASAREHGAQVIITACPLCQFNLDYPQRETEAGRTGNEIPVLYFTQLMAVALGLPEETWGMTEHYVDPRPLFDG